MNNRMSLALRDLRDGLFGPPIWLYLAWQEVRQRYRRSMLGPFWITISTGALIGGMGPLYGRLLHQAVGPYFQHLAISFVVWTLIAGYLNDVCNAYISAEGFIKQVKLPYSMFVMKVLAKNCLIFLHNLVIVVVVLIFFPPENISRLPLSLIGLVLVCVNLFWVGIVIAMLCARFRDIPQIISSCVQVLFFLTPIMWQADMLGRNRDVADWNLIYHWIELVRTPFLGLEVSSLSWIVSVASAVLGSAVALLLFSRYRARISYWV